MSDFRNRLRSIRETAERQASMFETQGTSPAESAMAQRFRDLSARIGDACEELAKGFADEFDGFENIRVAMEGGQCVRISRLEDVDGTRKLSRLTINVENLEPLPDDIDAPRGLHLSCKSIIFNRERAHDEIEIDFRLDDPSPTAPERSAAALVRTARDFAEHNILEFATAYEQARMTTLRPIA